RFELCESDMESDSRTRPKRILYITSATFPPESHGGAQQSALEILVSMKDLGWHVEVLCCKKSRWLDVQTMKQWLSKLSVVNGLRSRVKRFLGARRASQAVDSVEGIKCTRIGSIFTFARSA